jgi:uncharacterized protein YcaQ
VADGSDSVQIHQDEHDGAASQTDLVNLKQIVDRAVARQIAAHASMLGAGTELPADGEGMLRVVRHFGSLQLDPTRTVERTHLLVLWSRLGAYDRGEIDRVLWRERRLLEHNAFLVPIERLPELRYEAGPWINRWDGVSTWIEANRAFHDAILDQLRDRGPLQSRDIDDSKLVEGWRSSGWTHGKNTTRMLEFMAKALEVLVAGRQGQERLWDLAERVIPPDAPTRTLDDEAYSERRLDEAMRRFGVADLREIKTRTYWVPKDVLPRTIERFVEEGRLIPVDMPRSGPKRPAWATPAALEIADSVATSRTTLLSPFDPLVYDRERADQVFDFEYKLEMYVPRGERRFGHFTLPVLHDNLLVARLDSYVDRKTGALVVNRLHWENGATPAPGTARAVDEAIAELARFVGSGEVRGATE